MAMNVLFVDDDEVMAQSVELALRANGHLCEIAGLGEQAIALCKNKAYDIAVLDVGLPDMDALQVARRLKSAGVETPILLQTSQNDPDLLANAESLGAGEVLTKPFNIATLLDRMEQVLARVETGDAACEARSSETSPAVAEVSERDPAERRRHERWPVVEAAVMVEGERRIACVIVNLSESGAGIRLSDGDLDCPERFTLEPLKGEARACTQRWRKNAMIGVEFS